MTTIIIIKIPGSGMPDDGIPSKLAAGVTEVRRQSSYKVSIINDRGL